MSGETETHESGWTIDTLKYHMDERFRAYERFLAERDRLLDERKNEQDKNTDKALASVDKRLEGMNEFRGTLSDQAKSYITRQEYDSAHEALVERVGELASRIDRSEGSGVGKNQMWGYLIAAVAALGTIVIVTNVLLTK